MHVRSYFEEILGVPRGQTEIEVDPTQIKAIDLISPPRIVKEVQRLIGKLAALSHFVLNYSDLTKPFFAAIKNGKTFECTEECNTALEELAAYLKKTPLITKPLLGEQLLIYFFISEHAVGPVLVKEDEGRQHRVY